ncbi:TROVE domain-containing protein [Streptomyces sp. MST-110588]|uniref:TROVE domain-containing protein n=1 Tax=Streptomyces sp. MST-110588 TaxID=2833628 RepID=UPI001F5CFF95|nr:TROVE domain-containing protein [Streptomyces sp. MST-110588]UNO39125.1 TROVE domain-containing protein [Streptomyces sp. MST-110588]
MSKFNRALKRFTGTVTHEGGAAYTRAAKDELVLLAVVNMVGEQTFYEKAGERDERYRSLVRTVAVQDAEWTAGFLAWLRGEAGMRSASVVAAAEAVKARLDAGLHGGNRRLVDAVCLRADEPGELLAYWTGTYGRAVPKPVKRGLADAVRRLYTERALLKYDTGSHAFRFGDVLELVHATPHPDRAAWQGDLFRHALDRRHGRANPVPRTLATVRARAALAELPAGERRAVLERPDAAEVLRAAGMTWEAVAGWLRGPMDAAVWTALLPSMGYMALLRNLRNLDEAGVPDEVAEQVAGRLADPAEVARSRQFPYRFLSAYRAAPSLRWGHALETALTAASANIPRLPGRTLVLVDTSASMEGPVTGGSRIRHVDVGALFGVALAHRGSAVDLVGYATGRFRHPLTPGGSVLRDVDAFCARIGEVGHGTETVAALQAAYRGHDRVVIISDMQAFEHRAGRRQVSVSDAVPADVPVFGVDTTGYAASSIDAARPLRYEIGGFSDKLFTMVGLLAGGERARWPWETAAA